MPKFEVNSFVRLKGVNSRSTALRVTHIATGVADQPLYSLDNGLQYREAELELASLAPPEYPAGSQRPQIIEDMKRLDEQRPTGTLAEAYRSMHLLKVAHTGPKSSYDLSRELEDMMDVEQMHRQSYAEALKRKRDELGEALKREAAQIEELQERARAVLEHTEKNSE